MSFCILPYIIIFQNRQKVDHVVYTLPIYCVSIGSIIVVYIRDLHVNVWMASTNQDIAKSISYYALDAVICQKWQWIINILWYAAEYENNITLLVALSWSSKYFREFYTPAYFPYSPEKFAGTIHLWIYFEFQVKVSHSVSIIFCWHWTIKEGWLTI